MSLLLDPSHYTVCEREIERKRAGDALDPQ